MLSMPHFLSDYSASVCHDLQFASLHSSRLCRCICLCCVPITQAAVYPRVHALTYPLPEVGFDVHCLYGTGKDTDEGYVYGEERFSSEAPAAPKHVRKGPGDGTVNAHSLEACARCG